MPISCVVNSGVLVVSFESGPPHLLQSTVNCIFSFAYFIPHCTSFPFFLFLFFLFNTLGWISVPLVIVGWMMVVVIITCAFTFVATF